MPLSPRHFQYLIITTISLSSFPASAEPLNAAINVETATNNAAIQSQKKIDSISEKTQKMLEEYRISTHQIDTLVTYNKHLQDLVTSQKAEKVSLNQQFNEIENTQREIVPLILRMLDSLEKFVSLDLPFLPEERKKRLDKLKTMVVRADVTNAEKFRRILEAYQVENDYGNTIEAYRSDLTLNGITSSVDFLRLGRVALYYQHFDGSETGYWNKEHNKWQVLSTDYKNAIRKGLRVARKETAPNMLSLPIPSAEAGQ